MHIELRQLRYLLAAAEHGSFRKAARALNVAESAVSRRIADLEGELGVGLFIRDHSGATLTHAGQRFVAQTRCAIRQLDYATLEAGTDGRGERGIIRVGIFASLASGFFADLLATFVAENPDIRLDFSEASTSEHIAAVRQQRLDIAFVPGRHEVEDCHAEHLWSEAVFVVLPELHPLAEHHEIHWSQLRGYTFMISETEPGPEVHDYLVRHLSDESYRPAVERHAVYRDTLLQIVALGKGLTLTTAATTAVCARGIVYRPLVADELPFSAVWLAKNSSPALGRLLRAARKRTKGNSPLPHN